MKANNMQHVAFIGIGNMGKPMAMNLLKAGHAVSVYDIVPPDKSEWQTAGGQVADSPQAAIESANVIFTMLPAAKHVGDLWCDELLPSLQRREANAAQVLLVDCSTIDVATAQMLHGRADELGVMALDAPVSGGVSGATAAGLTFMCGGEAAAFAKAEPLLQAMGKNIFHCGTAGMGQATKICNNMMLGSQMIGVCESFALAEKLGLSPESLFKVSSVSSGQCWSLTTYCPWPGLVETAPSNRNYQAGFSAALMLKDLLLSQEAAKAAGVKTPLAEIACKAYEDFVAQYGEVIDFSAIINKIRESENA